MIAPSSISSTSSIASTPAGVVSRPPAFTVGRFHRRKASVTEPSASPAQNCWRKSTVHPTSENTANQCASAAAITAVWKISW